MQDLLHLKKVLYFLLLKNKKQVLEINKTIYEDYFLNIIHAYFFYLIFC